jgi:hypothetical protein
MITENQMQIFRQILDFNWEAEQHAQKGEHLKALEMALKRDDAEEKLKREMGVQQYEAFIKVGQEMFADKE